MNKTKSFYEIAANHLRWLKLNGRQSSEQGIFENMELSGCNLSAKALANAVFRNVTAVKCNAEKVNFKRSLFYNCDFTGANLKQANCWLVRFVKCKFNNATLQDASLEGAIFSNCDFTGCDLRGIDLETTNFHESIFNGANVDKSSESVIDNSHIECDEVTRYAGAWVDRPLLFRAFDFDNETMLDVESLSFDKEGRVSVCVEGSGRKIENAQVMQCAGVVDYYGQWMFEHDIIETKDLWDDSITYNVVHFRKGVFEFMAEVPANFDPDWESSLLHEATLSPSREYELKVVGNIYENPELLSKLTNTEKWSERTEGVSE